MRMTFGKAVVIGVDASPASIGAANVGWMVAQAADLPSRLVHATPEAWTVPAAPDSFGVEPEAINRAARQAAFTTVEDALRHQLPEEALASLEVRTGRAVTVIRDVVDETEAGLVVLGGKHHTTLGRWVIGSTAHTLVRGLDVPLLVTAHQPESIKQVIASVDLSDAAVPTARAAARFAEVFGAALHLLHVVEPLPIIPDTPLRFNDDEVYDHSREHLERYVWNKIDYPGVTTSMRRGTAAETIAQEVAEREAQLVVVGSHGKGWVDRILIGSITERVLSALPCTILVVPVAGPTSPRRPRANRSKQTP